jgi:hypothetical protein
VVDEWAAWLVELDLPVGTPYVISPLFEYDVVLNEFFGSAEMLAAAKATQVGYARDVAAFLTFLWGARDRRQWHQATTDDHVAYLVWRRRAGQGHALGNLSDIQSSRDTTPRPATPRSGRSRSTASQATGMARAMH